MKNKNLKENQGTNTYLYSANQNGANIRPQCTPTLLKNRPRIEQHRVDPAQLLEHHQPQRYNQRLPRRPALHQVAQPGFVGVGRLDVVAYLPQLVLDVVVLAPEPLEGLARLVDVAGVDQVGRGLGHQREEREEEDRKAGGD